MTLRSLAPTLTLAALTAAAAAPPDDAFETRVRPVLAARCINCHGPNQQLGGLRLDRSLTPEQARKAVAAIRYDGKVQMPPGGKLAERDAAPLIRWLQAGSVVPKAGAKVGAGHWAFQPVRRRLAPPVDGAADDIDAFVRAKLAQKGLTPAPEADRRTLIRRVTLDLTGLPPTPEDVAAFAQDTRPEAYEKVVDRLLASPAYGEKWGRHWLDVARYADSNGLDENLVFPNAWRYRDWVVGALNDDLPIDRFIQQQIAGDLLPDAGPRGIVATGYLALGAKMLAEDDPRKQEYDIIDEQVDTLGKTFLGMTLGCARCHDHKFDPIPQTDYYALAGIFKSTRTMKTHAVVAEWLERPVGSPAEVAALEDGERRIADAKAARKKTTDAADAAVLTAARARRADYATVAQRLAKQPALTLTPTIPTPDGPPPADAIVREAESYDVGNVIKDTGDFGKGIGVLVNRGEYPNVAEYAVDLPEAGAYQLDFRNASGDPRGFRVYVNGALVRSDAGSEVTGGFYPQHQRWSAQGLFAFRAGRNTLRFERDSYFPHVDKWLLRRVPGATAPETVATAAQAAGLQARFLDQALAQVKAGKEVAIELPESRTDLYPAEVRTALTAHDAAIAALEKGKPALPLAMAVGERETTDLKVQLRGNYLTEGALCPRGVPAVLRGAEPSSLPQKASGRLELARWMTSPGNPLTARVFVNRVWRWHFGRGIVPSPDNFGALGEPPTHPELLDWLAEAFVREDGWSLKRLHKRIVLSAAYRRSGAYAAKAAAKDPADTWLWRFPRRRLTAEELRDSLHFVAGTLDRSMGGTLLDFPARAYVTSTANADPVKYDSRRRALYLPVIRSATYDLYTAFDFGDPTVMNGDRPSTTVAPQALFLMNSETVLASSKALAARVRGIVPQARALQTLYGLLYQRPATDAELSRAADALNRLERAYSPRKDARERAWQSYCKVLLGSSEFVYVE